MFLTLDLMVRIWLRKESVLSKEIPRNLPVALKGIGLFWNRIGDASSSVWVMRVRFLNINSSDFVSLILIWRFPQYFIIWSMAFCRLDWISGRLGEVE